MAVAMVVLTQVVVEAVPCTNSSIQVLAAAEL
jgi:hypothetical protein